jgi:hypothetical protein
MEGGRMTWVTWRQYRYQGALAVALLAALAVVLLISGLHAADVWHSALAKCAASGPCGGLAGSGLSLGNPAFASLVVATSAVPLLPGLFWGAPAVAREMETGTNNFAWVQGITRRRWLAVRAGWLLLAAAVLAGAASALVTWWSGPSNALHADAFTANRFDVTDIVPAGYAVFAMALGICAGTVLRRTIPALAVTLAGFAAVRVLVAQVLRPHYMTPVTAYHNLTGQFAMPSTAYLGIGQGIVTSAGKPVPVDPYFYLGNFQVPVACQPHAGEAGRAGIFSCLASHHFVGFVSYQPASRFWAFQGIETGIFVALAAVLLAVAFWVLKRRDA